MTVLALTGWLRMPRRRLRHLFSRPYLELSTRHTAPCGVSKPGDLRGDTDESVPKCSACAIAEIRSLPRNADARPPSPEKQRGDKT